MTWAEMQSLLRADLERNESLLERTTVRIIRLGQWAHDKPAIVRISCLILDVLYLRLLIGADIPTDVRIGPGMKIPHAGRGIVIHPRVTIGARAFILHRVTIGANRDSARVPRLGDDVFVGNGASILGGVHVGNGARIGAHAVVLHDVGDNETALGVPAVIKAARTESPGVGATGRQASGTTS